MERDNNSDYNAYCAIFMAFMICKVLSEGTATAEVFQLTSDAEPRGIITFAAQGFIRGGARTTFPFPSHLRIFKQKAPSNDFKNE
jgi:hypothetical protein